MRGAPLDYEAFYRREFDDVFRGCILMTGSREVALDATQEAFTRAYVRWRRLRRHAWAGGWVMTTALNLCRRQGRVPVPVGKVDSSTVIAEAGPDRADLQRALATLPARQRQATILHYLGDLPVGAVAELMQISDSAVKSHLHAARGALRRTLEVTDV